jgi:hypothetical protein
MQQARDDRRLRLRPQRPLRERGGTEEEEQGAAMVH